MHTSPVYSRVTQHAVLTLVEKYSLPDPAAGNAQGEFQDLNLQPQITDNADVTLVYNSQPESSQNYLRAFTSQLTRHICTARAGVL